MTSEHPHPQRCETCKHKLPDCDKEDLGSRVCKKIFLEDPKSLQIGIPYFINMVGCASHSAAPERLCDECNIIEVEERLINAEQDLKNAIEQSKREERERVLKIIDGGKSALTETYDGHWSQIQQAKMDVLCWVEKSLRGEQP